MGSTAVLALDVRRTDYIYISACATHLHHQQQHTAETIIAYPLWRLYNSSNDLQKPVVLL